MNYMYIQLEKIKCLFLLVEMFVNKNVENLSLLTIVFLELILPLEITDNTYKLFSQMMHTQHNDLNSHNVNFLFSIHNNFF